MEKATFGAGCFWGVEDAFRQVPGVIDAISGYAGGDVVKPSYREVCTGRTGHAEVVEVTFDPEQVSYERLLDVFWQIHDPTTLNRQGPDVGTQYRSAIFAHSPEQGQAARASKESVQGRFNKPVVTEIRDAPSFFPAEDYHQRYFENNPGQGYCAFVVAPKVEKFRKTFAERVKPAA